MPRLPLFPLGTVLFPGADLPLTVFEPRYVEMIQDLATRRTGEQIFGVVSIRSGHEVGTDAAPQLSDIGTSARITSVGQHAGDPAGQTFGVAAVGEARFRLHSFDNEHTSYYTGDVEWLADHEVSPSAVADEAAQVRTAYARFARRLSGQAQQIEVPDESVAFEVMRLVLLPLHDRQAVLDEDDPVRRLAVVTQLLRREEVLFGGLRLAPAEARSFKPPSVN